MGSKVHDEETAVEPIENDVTEGPVADETGQSKVHDEETAVETMENDVTEGPVADETGQSLSQIAQGKVGEQIQKEGGLHNSRDSIVSQKEINNNIQQYVIPMKRWSFIFDFLVNKGSLNALRSGVFQTQIHVFFRRPAPDRTP